MVSAIFLLPLVPVVCAVMLAENKLLATRDSECTATHIFLAKGNNEPYPGRQGTLVNAICAGLESCDYEDIQFVNELATPYCQSLEEGAVNGNAQITAYNKRCPESNLVVSGYSQGAHVVGDIIGGGGGNFFQNCLQKTNAGLDPNVGPGNKIVAILTFGDTRHTASQPYNIQTGANSQGLFPRPENQLAGLRAFAAAHHDYCVITDPICAQGKVVATHLNYFEIFSKEAAIWVASRVSAVVIPMSVQESSSSSISSAPTSTAKQLTSSKSSLAVTSTESDASKFTSSPVIPTGILSESVTVSSAVVPTSVLTSISAAATSSKPNGAVSGTSGSAPGVFGLLVSVLIVML